MKLKQRNNRTKLEQGKKSKNESASPWNNTETKPLFFASIE